MRMSDNPWRDNALTPEQREQKWAKIQLLIPQGGRGFMPNPPPGYLDGFLRAGYVIVGKVAPWASDREDGSYVLYCDGDFVLADLALDRSE